MMSTSIRKRTITIIVWIALAVLVFGAVFIFNASTPGNKVEGCLSGCNTQSIQDNSSLRIATLNMLHGHPDFENLEDRLDLIVREIRNLDAGIVILQEVPWTRKLGSSAEYLANELGMNYAYLRANGNRHTIFFEEGELILSRYELINPDYKVLNPKASFFQNRIVLYVTAVTPWGNIGIFNTHLTNGEQVANWSQIDDLKAYVDSAAQGSLFSLVAGDFNATPDEGPIQLLRQDWLDVHPQVDYYTCCIEDLNKESAFELNSRIDYVFLVGGSEIELFDVERVFDVPSWLTDHWQWPSDHVGLFVEIK